MHDSPEQADADLDLKLRRYDQATLLAMLAVLQERLGTAEERPQDLSFVRAIAHRLSNLISPRARSR